MVNYHINHNFNESPIKIAIKPTNSKTGGWRKMSLFSSDGTRKISIQLYMTESGITHVYIYECGAESIEFDSCALTDGESWLTLVVAKIQSAVQITCNGGIPIVYGEECSETVGNDVKSFLVEWHCWLKESLLYSLPQYLGDMFNNVQNFLNFQLYK